MNSLSISLVGVLSLSVGAGLDSVTFYSFNVNKERIFLYILDRRVFTESVLLFLGYVLAHSFSDTMLLYLSISF